MNPVRPTTSLLDCRETVPPSCQRPDLRSTMTSTVGSGVTPSLLMGVVNRLAPFDVIRA